MGRCGQRTIESGAGRLIKMAYQQMAHVYDQLMIDAPYDAWVSLTKEIFKRSGKKVQTIADLGCGTGQITIRLARNGFNMYGIDYSSDMLSHAEQTASAEKLPVQWICQDLRKLDGLHDLDAAISYCDVINYITSENELRTVFAHVANMLKPEGLFIFDVHSMYHVEHHFLQQTFAEATDELAYIWYCAAGDKRGEMYHDMTFFTRENGHYRRFDEVHHQRTFPATFYGKLLKESGFQICNLCGDFSLKSESVHEKTERIFIIAEKRPGK